MTEDIDGEWQWPNDLSEMKKMESTLRCKICGDYFNGPVLLPCGHSFCSVCIRKYLQSMKFKGCCAECKKPCASGDLVQNRCLEIVANLFQEVKPKILKLKSNNLSIQQENSSSKRRKMNDDKRNTAINTRKRVPMVSYNHMKEKELRNLVNRAGIPHIGRSRENIIELHREYVLLMNAQLDSENPLTEHEVIQDIIEKDKIRAKQKRQLKQTKVELGLKPNEGLDKAAMTSQVMISNFQKLKEQIIQNKMKGSQTTSTESDDLKDEQTKDKSHNETINMEKGISKQVITPCENSIPTKLGSESALGECKDLIDKVTPEVVDLSEQRTKNDTGFCTARRYTLTKDVELTSEDSSQWSCPLCTYLNASTLDFCAMCANARPGRKRLNLRSLTKRS